MPNASASTSPGKDSPARGQFVVATPQRTVCDDNARVLEKAGLLRFLALGTRRGTPGVSSDHTRLNPLIGLTAYAAGRSLSNFNGESFRFRLLPWFDRWVLKQLQPGDHILSSYGYVNKSFRFVRQHGGLTFVDAGNSHIEQFWEIMVEENRRWNCPYLPVARHWYERSRRMLQETDYVLSPSNYVTQSFLKRGFKPEQILRNIYPVNLQLFRPAPPRKRERLTVINTGMLSLRKGTPYLLEAFRLLRKTEPSARLLLTRNIRNDVEPILANYRDLPIEWTENLPHAQLAEHLRQADVFVLPSLEEGLVRTALEAMACGLQVVLTPNTGANDFVTPGVHGEVVPIRDAPALCEAILKCWSRLQTGAPLPTVNLDALSFESFEKEFLAHLTRLELLSDSLPR